MTTTHGTMPGIVAPVRIVSTVPARKARLRERAAKAGVHVHIYDDEDTGRTVFVVSRRALTRQLESIDAAEKWFDLVLGVEHG